MSLDSGCNGVVFIQMHKRAGDPSPTEIVQHMMTNAASTKKHMSRSNFHSSYLICSLHTPYLLL